MLSDLPHLSSTNNHSRMLHGSKLRARLWIACLLAVIGGCQILPGHWRPGWNEPWPTGTLVPDTAGRWKLAERGSREGRFLATAICGGGSRGAKYGAAVMLELQLRGR